MRTICGGQENASPNHNGSQVIVSGNPQHIVMNNPLKGKNLCMDTPLFKVIMWFQFEPFASLVYCGQPVRRCIMFRLKEFQSFAARLLGKLVCCRWMTHSEARAQNLAAAIDFGVPPGFQLQMCVGDRLFGPDALVYLHHCETVALRLVLQHRPVPLGAAPGAGADDDHDPAPW